MKKMPFYLIVFLYTEIVTEFCSSFFLYVFDKSMPSFGDPGKFAELTPVCVAICVILLIIFSCLILIPLIWLTIKSKHDNVRITQIFLLWGSAVLAGVLGVLFATWGFTMPCKAAEILADSLNQKLNFFKTSTSL